jgi:AraC family transcriptional regulator
VQLLWLQLAFAANQLGYVHMSHIQNTRDWYTQGEALTTIPQAIRRIALHHDRVIDVGPVQLMTASGAGGPVIEPATPEYTLVMLLRTAPLFRVGFNRQPRWLTVSPGSLLFTPPDTDCEFIGEALGKCLCMVIPKARVEEFAQESDAHIDLRMEETFRDASLMQQLAGLWHALAAEATAIRLYADEVTRAVMGTLARRTGTLPRHSSRAARERLPTHRLRRLCEYIEASLAEDLDVAVMAGVANLSPAHFARAFAATVGTTPFRYVMTRRLARACELLQHTRRSTLDIALEVGFKSPSHFAARFHREFGVTPRSIRRDQARSLLHMQV